MKPTFWKEWRENYGWALLGAGIMVLSCIYTLSRGTDYRDNWYQTWSNNFPLAFTIMSPILAAALGFLQSMRELKRDQWAFLVHRPVPRSHIFVGKVTAGLLLYFSATLLPLLLMGCWLANSGRLSGPFFWQLLLPGVADVLAGVPLYLAAFVTAMRPARWYGSRALGLPAAVLCNLLVVSMPEFWHALLAVLFFSALLGTAAWSCFTSGGHYRSQSAGGRFALSTTLFLGTITVAVGSYGLLSASLYRPTSYNHYQYEMNSQGELNRVQFQSGVITEVTDSAGRKLPPPPRKARWTLNEFLPQSSVYLSEVVRSPTYGYRDPRRFANLLEDYSEGNRWYYLPGQKLIYGYNAGRMVGIMGRDGFVRSSTIPPQTQPKPFEGERLSINEWDSTRFLGFTSGLYWLELSAPHITPVFTPPVGQSIRSIDLGPYTDSMRSGNRAMAATAKDLYFIRDGGKNVFQIPLESGTQPKKPASILVYDNGRNYFLWYRNSYPQLERTSSLVTLSARGEVLERRSVVLPVESKRPTDTTNTPFALFAPLGSVLALGLFLLGGKVLGFRMAMQTLDSFQADPAPVWLFLGYTLLGALISAVLCWRIAGRCAMPTAGQLRWAVGGFLLGPFGVLMMLGLLEWPSRETCAACGKQRVVTRENCEHCGANWPEPELDGTEIFSQADERERSLAPG